MNHIWFFYVLVYVLTFKYSILTFAYWLVHRSSHNLIKFPRIPDMRGQASIFLFGLKEMACLTLCKKRPSLTHVEKKGRRSYTATKKGRHSHMRRENVWRKIPDSLKKLLESHFMAQVAWKACEWAILILSYCRSPTTTLYEYPQKHHLVRVTKQCTN